MHFLTLLADAFILTGIVTVLTLSLVAARQLINTKSDRLIEEVNELLPQTQCAQCGYAGCQPYAEAIAKGEAINLCPPGGTKTAQQLAKMLGRPIISPDAEEPVPAIAKIIESECIGCTLCIAACPVDAIIGTHQQMHTVITEVCTGCELCIEPCPVDCIDLLHLPTTEPPEFPIEDRACINCGFCETVCPRNLRPHHLYMYKQSQEIPKSLHLDDCIECGRCDRVCPSQISLTLSFQITKMKQEANRRIQAKSRMNEQRFIKRQERVLNNQALVVSKPSEKDLQSIVKLIRIDT